MFFTKTGYKLVRDSAPILLRIPNALIYNLGIFLEYNYMYVYLLECNGSTYVGATVDLNRRLRQHNQELSGGARATGRKVSKGETWRRVAYVSGFPSWIATLQFEWRWKQLSRRIDAPPMERRMKALYTLLLMDKSTEKAIPFLEWESMPELHIECDTVEKIYITCATS
jgi:predicted GIY-YIG superfamily endonuclease